MHFHAILWFQTYKSFWAEQADFLVQILFLSFCYKPIANKAACKHLLEEKVYLSCSKAIGFSLTSVCFSSGFICLGTSLVPVLHSTYSIFLRAAHFLFRWWFDEFLDSYDLHSITIDSYSFRLSWKSKWKWKVKELGANLKKRDLLWVCEIAKSTKQYIKQSSFVEIILN